MIGGHAAVDAHVAKTVCKVSGRHAVLTINDPAMEVSLTRRCLGVSKLGYALRCPDAAQIR